MSSQFKKGDKVCQVVPAPIQGEVVGFSLCNETGEVYLVVAYTNADGEQHSRQFRQSEMGPAAAE